MPLEKRQNGPKSKSAKWAETPLSPKKSGDFGLEPHFDPIFGHFMGNFRILADFA